MTWAAYQVVLRLYSPLHIGWGRVSYLQRARPYVSGRVLRGALINRVARNKHESGEDAGDPYRAVSKTFAQYLTFTYFYPALKSARGDWNFHFPWEREADFRRRFLSSYAAASLEYPQQRAAEGLLYETEFIAPYALDDGQPVHLMGYFFVNEERLRTEKYDWKGALRRLQLGGERGYGWGDARLIENGIRKISDVEDKLFGTTRFSLSEKRPVICLKKDQPVLAHTPAKDVTLAGNVEPVVGREWRADKGKYIGQHLAFNDVCFAPGSLALCNSCFAIGEGGYWRPIEQQRGSHDGLDHLRCEHRG